MPHLKICIWNTENMQKDVLKECSLEHICFASERATVSGCFMFVYRRMFSSWALQQYEIHSSAHLGQQSPFNPGSRKKRAFLVWEEKETNSKLVSLVCVFLWERAIVLWNRLVLPGFSNILASLIITCFPLSITIFNEHCCMKHHCLSTVWVGRWKNA